MKVSARKRRNGGQVLLGDAVSVLASMKALQNCREMGSVSAARGSRVEPQ